MEPVETFWCEETGEVDIDLRRNADGECPGEYGYHRAVATVGRAPVEAGGYLEALDADDWADHPQWPTVCGCGHPFDETADRHVDQERIYVTNEGVEFRHDRLPVGAMYDSWWARKGPDGVSLAVVVPPGRGLSDHWQVDMRANNCDRKDWPEHYCWVRHGNPREERVDVSKGAEGESCTAGAGSISKPDWHGFLSAGFLKQA